MKLWVGLGNPGRQYAGHRHNIGFMAVERIAAEHRFSPWRCRFQGEAAEGRLNGEKIMLLKPQTFMNRSGQAVGEAARYFRLDAENVTVFHDELDLAPGKCRMKQGGGHAGHNGLRSIIEHLGAEFARVRLGIGHPGRKDMVTAWVLHDFARADADWLDDLLRGLAEGAPALAAGDGARFLNAIAARTAPARNAEKGKPAGSGERGASRDPADSPIPASPLSARTTEDGRSALQRLVDRFRRG